MRIIAGQRRGHKFDGPRDDATRPTSDFVRESIFNILGDSVEGTLAIDLYAGAGGLGLEALSRGASRAIFVELNRDNAALVRRNVATLRYEDRARVQVADAHRWARAFEPDDDSPIVVFLDPPYREYENHPERVRKTVEVLLERLPSGSILVVESRSDLDDAVLPDLGAWDLRRYGSTQVAFRTVERAAIEPSSSLDEPPNPHDSESEPMSNDPRRDFAASVVGRLRESGHEAYWAGGCVRDILLGLDPADYDVATDARPEQVVRLFRRTIGVGASFGVIKVLGPREAGDVEVATFRSDGAYLDGRRPEAVTFSTAEFDASRRDFTINGMFLDPADGRVIDFVGGRADLDSQILRAIGDPSARFAEDKLRLLRAVRFAARFGFALEPDTRAAVEAMAPQVVAVSAERIAQELRRMLTHSSRSLAMQMALDTGLIAAVLPPLVALEAFPESTAGDLWTHTLRVLDHLPDSPSFPLAFAALLHDVGKPGEDSSFARASRAIALDLATALKLSNAERDHLAWLIEHQHALTSPQTLRPSRLKRLLASGGIDDLLALHRAEALATSSDLAPLDFCARYLRDLPDGPIDPPPLLTGTDLIRHGLKPGPRFAPLLEQIRDAQLDGTIATRDDALALVDRLEASRPDEPRRAIPRRD